MGVGTRDISVVLPGEDGTYRDWVKYRTWEEFKYFVSGNQMNLKQVAAFFWEGDEAKRGLTKLQNWLYDHVDVRNISREDFAHLEIVQRKKWGQLNYHLDLYYIMTGYRSTREEEMLRLKVESLEKENAALKTRLLESEALLKEYRKNSIKST